LRHFMYSLPNPSESERLFSPLEEPVLRALGRRGGGARNGTQGRRDATPLAEEDTGSKGPVSLALGSWPWGGGYGGGGGMGTGSKREGGGVFFTADLR
jgi:hypothetical protein